MTVVPINAAQGWTLGGSEAAAACGIDPYRSRFGATCLSLSFTPS
jgi:hypothetical protein